MASTTSEPSNVIHVKSLVLRSWPLPGGGTGEIAGSVWAGGGGGGGCGPDVLVEMAEMTKFASGSSMPLSGL